MSFLETLHPRYWLKWALVLFLKLFVLLPFRLQIFIGSFLGRVGYSVAKRRREISYKNLKLCFPEKSDNELKAINIRSFREVGMCAIETMVAWLMPKWRFKFIKFNLSLPKDYDPNQPSEKGTLLLSGHFNSLEIIGRLMATRGKGFNLNLVYQKHKSKFFEYIMTRSREKYVDSCIQRKNVIKIVRTLKSKLNVWYAPDQDFGNERSIFVPFFGEPCSTLDATPWLSNHGNAKIMPCYYHRDRKKLEYTAVIEPVWENFPTENKYDDAKRYNSFLERVIRLNPSQYLWQHRRFKTRPEGMASVY